MSQGYPSRSRAKKAFERGYQSVRRGKTFRPYTNPTLADLFERGREKAIGAGVKAEPTTRPPSTRPPTKRRDNR
jgi:hypothetical protein